MTTPRFAIDRNPVDALWKQALPAALDNLHAMMVRPAFAKLNLFKPYETPTFRAHWNLTYMHDYVELLKTLQFFLQSDKHDGVLHVSHTYSTYVQVSYGFIEVEMPYSIDDYVYAVSIDLLTYDTDRLRVTLAEQTDPDQSTALWQIIDLIDGLPRLPSVTYDTPLRRLVEARP